MSEPGLIILAANLLVLFLLYLRFFQFADKMERYMRAQTALISLMTRRQGQKPNVNSDVDVFNIISENDLIEELPLKRDPEEPEMVDPESGHQREH